MNFSLKSCENFDILFSATFQLTFKKLLVELQYGNKVTI